MPIGNSVLRCFRNVVRDSEERTLRGIEFHMGGADTRKEREPNQRLVRGTWRSFDEEEHRPLVGA